LDFQKKLIKIFTISIFYLKLKENIENDVAAHAFLGCFLFQPTAKPNWPNS
jgi:hypothetical protein